LQGLVNYIRNFFRENYRDHNYTLNVAQFICFWYFAFYMERVENNEYKERPFERLKVYFSNSIKGEIGKVEDIGVSVVTFLIEKGADVLSENVAFLKPEIGLPIFQRRTGIDLTKVTDDMERARIIRKADINWVDNATFLVSLR